MSRRDDLTEIFKKVSEDKRTLVSRLIDDVVWYEDEIAKLKKLPQIRMHPKNPEVQKKTAAAKLLKEYSQSYMNAVRILLGVLNKEDTDDKDELLKRLSEFE
ncbi:MAG: hypothetical protein K6F88_00295 [Ruminococcus sp.]|nr:hypothetical protein [Ruminococcus sp.]